MRFFGRWGDMDFNGHVRNTAYLDVSGDVRMSWFQQKGFTMADFRKHGIGPVLRQDELVYFREIKLLEPYDVTLECAGLSEDASHFKLRNRFTRVDGKKSAVVTSAGGWMDIAARKLTLPPEALATAMREIARSDDFAVLPSSVGR